MENKNYMKQLAEILGVELNEEFTLRYDETKYRIVTPGLQYYNNVYKRWLHSVRLENILIGNCTIVKIPKKDTKIFSVFPVSGTTYATKKLTEEGYKVLDLDSKEYSHSYQAIVTSTSTNFNSFSTTCNTNFEKNKNPSFPQNYIKAIKEAIGKYDFIFVSTHKEVREDLEKNNIRYSLVYPNYSMKNEWIGRCYLRGDTKEFCDKLANNWDQWNKELDNVTYSKDGCTNKVFLNSSYDTCYLYDAIKKYYIKGE